MTPLAIPGIKADPARGTPAGKCLDSTAGYGLRGGWGAYRAATVWTLALLLSGCAGIQSSLAPKGPAAQAISLTWWAMFWGAWAILALVIVLVLYAVFRRPEKRLPISGPVLIVGGGLVFPTLTLAVLLVYGTHTSNRLAAPAGEALRIEVIGHQWWWEVRYPGAVLEQTVATANEIHIPAARPVEIAVTTHDVIHSFWVPRLAGKIDLIPGKVNTLWLQADQPGLFRGQCAEFCGAQHARMAFLVVAHRDTDFADWLERQRRAAAEPNDPLLINGRDAFLSAGCGECHTVRGTLAAGVQGPDLTHVASRHTLAAGTLTTHIDTLTAWVADSQAIKPGNKEPPRSLDPPTVTAIAAYLESLK